MSKLTIHIPADHPTGAGHFPGNPIVPGALLLASVVHCIEQEEGKNDAACNVRNAKFLAPARPGDTVVIEYMRSPQGTIEFKCEVAGVFVLSGGFIANE